MSYNRSLIPNVLNASSRIDYSLSSLLSATQETINSTLITEFNSFLNRAKYQHSSTSKNNYRNGYYKRQLLSPFGVLNILMPRDRNSQFHSHLQPYQRNLPDFQRQINALILSSLSYAKCSNLTSTLVNSNYSDDTDFSISSKTISRYAKNLSTTLSNFNSAPITESFLTLFVDTTYFNFHKSDNHIVKLGLSIALGMNDKGQLKVLGFRVCDNENTRQYSALLNNLFERGLKSVSLVVADGMAGIEKVVKKIYPDAYFQTCLVHVKRNLKRWLSPDDYFDFVKHLDFCLKSETYKEAIQRYNAVYELLFIRKPYLPFWNIPPSHLFAFLHLPKIFQKRVYTNNPIEGLNAVIKNKFRARISESETTLIIDLHNIFTTYNKSSCEKKLG